MQTMDYIFFIIQSLKTEGNNDNKLCTKMNRNKVEKMKVGVVVNWIISIVSSLKLVILQKVERY